MQPNATKAKLLRGELVFGLFISSPDPTQVELAAEAGMDFVRIDCEHGPMTLETVENMIRAAEAGGITPLARVPVTRPEVVLQYMDRGLAGIIFPHVSTPEDAAQAVRYMKFAPLGERGFSGRGGMVRWPLRIPEADVHEFANRETMVICLVEDVAGFQNIDRIAAVPGVDVVMVGPGDLSQSMGYIKDRNHPEVRRVVDDGIRRVRQVGKPVSIAVGNPADTVRLKEYVDQGVQMFHFIGGPLYIWAMGVFRERVRSGLPTGVTKG